MLNKVLNFYNSHKSVVLWTIGYFIATWAIMRFMFNFDILSAHRWWQLVHAHLHGFAGLVFGILILAAVPMYIATTIVIARTNAPLFTVKIPEFIKRAFEQTPMEEAPETTSEPEPEKQEPASEQQKNDTKTMPDSVPSEMRVAYARAREHLERTPTSAFDLSNVTKVPQTPQSEPEQNPTAEDIPIPTDFDIDDIDDITSPVPHFVDINFDDDEEPAEKIADIKSLSETIAPVAEYLTSQSVPFGVIDDVITTDKFAIVAHTDPDFWVADADAWFAAGKTRKSPIDLVKRVATEHNIEPVLYLGANNIMDIENLVPQWEQDGIHVITELKNLI